MCWFIFSLSNLLISLENCFGRVLLAFERKIAPTDYIEVEHSHASAELLQIIDFIVFLCVLHEYQNDKWWNFNLCYYLLCDPIAKPDVFLLHRECAAILQTIIVQAHMIILLLYKAIFTKTNHDIIQTSIILRGLPSVLISLLNLKSSWLIKVSLRLYFTVQSFLVLCVFPVYYCFLLASVGNFPATTDWPSSLKMTQMFGMSCWSILPAIEVNYKVLLYRISVVLLGSHNEQLCTFPWAVIIVIAWCGFSSNRLVSAVITSAPYDRCSTYDETEDLNICTLSSAVTEKAKTNARNIWRIANITEWFIS